jgi:hypothetical protein
VKKAAKSKVKYEIIKTDHEVYNMIGELISQFHSQLADAKIVCCWMYDIKPDKDGNLRLGQCMKAGGVHREIHGYDFIILLNYNVWNNVEYTSEQKKAQLDHELTHADVTLDKDGEEKLDEKGRPVWRVRKHDVEDFSEIIKRYGVRKYGG